MKPLAVDGSFALGAWLFELTLTFRLMFTFMFRCMGLTSIGGLVACWFLLKFSCWEGWAIGNRLARFPGFTNLLSLG